MQVGYEFFKQLKIFSDRFVGEDQCEWHSSWGCAPNGVIIHYTANDSLRGTVRWFGDRDLKARTSAHWVVGDRRDSRHEELAHDLPLIQQLPVTVVQMVDLDRKAWHATWANRWAFGIENVNPGYGDEGTVHSRGKDWCPYPPAQLHANVTLIRHLMAMFPTMTLDRILGHEHVQSDNTVVGGSVMRSKWDPGPMYPLHGIRQQVLWQLTPNVDNHIGSLEPVEDMEVLRREYKLWGRVNVRCRFWGDLGRYVKRGDPTYVGGMCLRLLGYDSPRGQRMSDTAIRIFQRMMGLTVDGVVGPVTRRALRDRLIERRIFA